MLRVHVLRSQCLLVVGRARSRTDLRESKVKNLGLTTLSNKDVGWFNVSMDDVFRMRSMQALGHANRHIQQRFQVHRPTCDGVFQGLTFEKFHSDESPTAMLSNFVNGANVRMIQCGSGTSFPAEAFEGLWVFCEVFGQELQGSETAKLGILGLINDTHPTPAQLFQYSVVGDGLADECAGLRHSAAILGCHLRQVNESKTALLPKLPISGD